MEGAVVHRVTVTPDVWLSLVFAAALVATYVFWCAEVLPRLRLLLVIVGVVCFVIAIELHGNLFAAAPTKPEVAPIATPGLP